MELYKIICKLLCAFISSFQIDMETKKATIEKDQILLRLDKLRGKFHAMADNVDETRKNVQKKNLTTEEIEELAEWIDSLENQTKRYILALVDCSGTI